MTTNTLSIKIESGMTLNKMLGDNNAIEIPIIQRDYAQGRRNAKEIRTDFLKDIFAHLDDNKPMKLSFVYGTTNGSMYVPYDGQQRLTLVYLLTIFLAAYCEDWVTIKKLSRFNYYTRDHATAFCMFLTCFDTAFDNGKKNVFQRIDIHGQENIAKSICNDSAFFGSWRFEPTVSSMIVVLRSIQKEYESVTEKSDELSKISKAKDYLSQIDNGKIFFDWCSIQASDNIYIKMNGRGKPLSAFDNFKNTLYAELDKLRKKAVSDGEKYKADFVADFEIKMDGVWTDMFWKNRDMFIEKKNYDIAPYMMNFLYYLFELRHAISSKSFFFGGKESFKWIDEKNVVKFLVKFKELCDVTTSSKKGQIVLDDYIWISKLLDVLSNRLDDPTIDTSLSMDFYSEEKQLLKELSSHSGNVGSSRTVIVSSLYFEYLVAASEFDANGTLISTDCSCRYQWINLIGRLIKTASKFKARYDALLRDKHILSGYANLFVTCAFNNTSSGDLLVSSKNFSSAKLKDLKSYFDSSHVYSQLVEELKKYELRNTDPTVWNSLIDEAEKDLPFFDNMIYFLIKLAEDVNHSVDSNQFSRYLSIIKKIVGDRGVRNQNEFSAIMLSFADYRISCGEGYSNSLSLCSNTSNDSFSWRYFFDVIEGRIVENGKSKVDALRNTLELFETHDDIKKAYESLNKDSSDPSWKSVIIRFPEVLDMGSKHRIIYKDWENWYLVKSEGVVKQVHSNSLYDSINLELYGLYRSYTLSNQLTFEGNRISFGKGCFIKKDNEYIIHDSNGESKMNYFEVLGYLNNL